MNMPSLIAHEYAPHLVNSFICPYIVVVSGHSLSGISRHMAHMASILKVSLPRKPQSQPYLYSPDR